MDLKQKLLFICTATKISYDINISSLRKTLPAGSLAPPPHGDAPRGATFRRCDHIFNIL